MATGRGVAQAVDRRRGVAGWLRNIASTVTTVAEALWVTVRYWVRTYDPQRRTFTEHYEYPELPLEVAPAIAAFTVSTSLPASLAIAALATAR